MIDCKTHTLFSKIFLSITLFWIYPSLCLASGTGSIYYLEPMPPRPMSIRTGIEPALPTVSIRTGIEPALPTDGENALEEIGPMHYVQYELEHKLEHVVEDAILPEVPAAAHPAPLPPVHPAPLPPAQPAPLPPVSLPMVSTPIPTSPPEPPPEIQVDSTYANSTIQKPNVIMNCLIDDFDMISIAVSNRLSNLFEKR